MKWHVFSLNRVMRVRATQESIARQGLSAAVGHAMRAEEEYDVANRRYQASLATQASLRGSGMTMMVLRDLDAIRARAVVDADRCREDSHLAVADAQAQWADAKQKLAALERLDEREREVHQRALLAEQDAEADDIVSTRKRALRSDPLVMPGDGGPR